MRALLLVSLVVATVACANDGTGTGVDAFPARFAGAWCDLLARCCVASNGAEAGTCDADEQTRLEMIKDQALASGSTWQADAAGACLAAIAATECGLDVVELRALVETCSNTWTGTLAPGSTCQTYAQCVAPAPSGDADTGVLCSNNKCVQVVRQPVGGTCTATATPPTFVVCDPLLAACSNMSCVALPVAGEPCVTNCQNGFRCEANVCVATLATGEACVANGQCASDTCSAGLCASALAVDSDFCALP